MLVLGSMPGEASLAAGQYYAHPQNHFWRILGEVLGFDAAVPYALRLEAVKAARIAVWDVLHSCHRPGSLDASIHTASMEANDFAAFFAANPAVRTVLFNGAKAEECWRRHVLARGIGEGLDYRRLPSTSPANASWSYARRLEAWRSALTPAVNCA